MYAAADIPYIEPDSTGDIDVIRTPDAVFNPASMASFEGIAVVINHPRDARGDILSLRQATGRAWRRGMRRISAGARVSRWIYCSPISRRVLVKSSKSILWEPYRACP
ncbi:DUF2213 domain-containing protein [Sodalis glossinidius]|uniref:DUF2213 domain-containing protein n=1 Tax=Sodalis glossinidius TaxID=63612 RepID=UPI003C780E78